MPDWHARLRRRLDAAGWHGDPDILEELSAHAAAEYERRRADGHDAAAAERHVENLVDTWVRDAAELNRPPGRPAPATPPPGTAPLTGLLQDVRYGARLLRREPGFALVAILTMALGIGATTLLFGIAYGVLLKPLPWANAERLVRVTETREGRAGRVAGTVSNGTFLAWRDHPSTIDDVGGWLTQTATLTGVGDPVRIPLNPTTPSLFPLLGVQPLVGRLFRDGEGASGEPGVLLLSYGLWQERFGGDREAVGRLIRLDDKPYTIVGVMPRTFAFPDRESRAWTAWTVPGVTTDSGALVGVIFRAVARLRAGATPERAAAEATARARTAPDMGLAARALFGAAGPIDVAVTPEMDALTGEVRPAVLILLAAGALLLITATANVASLQLARAAARRRELALRAAIGAGHRRLLRQLVIENGLLGLCGGAAGVAAAAALQRVLPTLLPPGFPRADAVALDVPVLLVALALSLAASVACGLLPAWHARRTNLVATLAEDGLAPIGAMRSPLARTRAAIMAGQVAIACVLLVGAALLARSFVSLIHADRGYDPLNVLTARLAIPAAQAAERRDQILEAIVDRLSAAPGVAHAAYSTSLPFVSAGGFTAFTMRSPLRPDAEVEVQATQRVVSPGYFGAMGLRLVDGRLLADTDTTTTPPAIVVNRTFARQYLGDRPVGVRLPARGPRAGGLRFPDDSAGWEVVGVVDDMRQEGVDAPPQPEVFASFKQLVPGSMRSFDPFLVIRTTGDPLAMATTLRAVVRELAPALALDSVMTMEDRVMNSLARPRLYAVILTAFGVFAVLIAGVGLFGVLSFSVAQRTREIGVRSALGAQARDIVGLVLRQALWIVGSGAVLGVAAALAGTRLLAAFLYGIGPHDALTFLAVPLVVAAVGAVACIVPARRAATVDPLTALRKS